MPDETQRNVRSIAKTTIRITAATLFVALIVAGNLSQPTTHASTLSQAGAKNPLSATEKNAALGLNHFDAHCARCHGATGKSDTELGNRVRAADLTLDKTSSKSDSELFRIISRGIPGTAMPAFSKTHNSTEIWQTILFLRRLPTLTAEERKRLEAAVPAEARHKHGDDKHQHSDVSQPATRTQPAAEHQHEGAAKPQAQPQKPAAEPQHRHGEQPATTPPAKPQGEHAGHEMSKTPGGHDAASMMSTIAGGPFKSMHAMGSGTSLLPATTPGYMWMWMKRDWMIMAHTEIKIGFNHQGGPRGVNKAESQNMLMLMAEREAGGGRLMLRGMFSAEPLTAPRGGFPQLFQTGETYRGRPIIDAQHPHDLFMELSAAYTLPISERVSINLYGGPVAEPALGPVAFMHRASAMENPAAPLGHHLQDSTHIAHGVFTAGVTAWRFRIESSVFRGAEPDENRETIDLGKLDSWSSRIWFTPTPSWAMQFSYGHLVNPEAAEPGDINRMTASISYNRPWSDGNWATSFIWGRNHEDHGNFNGYLLESTANFLDKNYLYTRLELVDRTGLLNENIFGRRGLDSPGSGSEEEFDPVFRVGAFTFGAVRDIVTTSKLRLGLGADATFYRVPDALKPIYGSSPTSFHLFLRIRPSKMSH
jgi:mono/diheme cytochrome c family protein